MKITYFVHGTTTDNEKGKATGWLPGELSQTGIEQAKQLPDLISDSSFECVYSSDLKRSVDSANLGFGITHKCVSDKRLREANYGDWNGGEHHFKDKMSDFINNKFPNGESYKDTEARMRSFIDDTKKQGYKHIAIVAHEAP